MKIISVDLSTGLVVHQPTASDPNNSILPITNIAYQKLPELIPVPTASFHSSSDGLTVEMRDISRYARSYLWDFGDGFTHTAQFPSHTYAAAGTYTVSLIVENAVGSDTLTQDMTVTNAPTNLDSESLEASLELYPNPARDQVSLLLSQPLSGFIHVTDMAGRILYEREVENTVQILFSVQNWTAGLYFVSFETSQGVFNRKLRVD